MVPNTPNTTAPPQTIPEAPPEAPVIWILSDGKPGHLNQSFGVAEAIGTPASHIITHTLTPRKNPLLRWIYRLFAPHLEATGLPTLTTHFKPDILISTGRLTAGASRYLKRQFPNLLTIHLMRPGGRLTPPTAYAAYDVLAIPSYDKGVPAFANIIRTVGAPNRISPERLQEADTQWQKSWEPYPQPHLAVLLGGSSKKFTFTATEAETLAETALALAQKLDSTQENIHTEKTTPQTEAIPAQNRTGSILCTPSRRTPQAAAAMFKQVIEKTKTPLFYWSGEGENPYLGMLAAAEAFLVTPDSVSMISEACTTGKPVFVMGLDKVLQSPRFGKFGIFLQTLKDRNLIADAHTAAQNPPALQAFLKAPRTPLADATRIAGFVHALRVKKGL